ARRGVTVVRPEAAQVDVADEGHAFGLDQQHAMARRVPRHVDGAHARTAEFPDRAVAIADRVRARRVEELAPDLGEHRFGRRRRQPVVAQQPGPAAHRFDVAFVDVHCGARQAVQPRHVVLVRVPEHDQLRVVENGADAVRDQRRVERRARVAAADHHLVAVGILARLLAEVDGDSAEVEPADGVGHGRWGGGESLGEREGPMVRPRPAQRAILSPATVIGTTPGTASPTLAQRCAPIAATDKNPAGETDMRVPRKSLAETLGECARAASSRQLEPLLDAGDTGFPRRRQPHHRRRLGAISRVLALGVLVIGGLWGFMLSLGLISDAAGLWGVAVGVALAPITVVATPLYAVFASGDWAPLALNYGGGVASALLSYLGAALASE